MKKTKQLISIILVAIMLVCTVPMGASAEGTDDLGYRLTAEVSYDRYWLQSEEYYSEYQKYYYNPETCVFSLIEKDMAEDEKGNDVYTLFQYNIKTDSVYFSRLNDYLEQELITDIEEIKRYIKVCFAYCCNEPMPRCEWKTLYGKEYCPNFCTEWWMEDLGDYVNVTTVEAIGGALISEDGKYVYEWTYVDTVPLLMKRGLSIGGIFWSILFGDSIIFHAPLGHIDEDGDETCDRCGHTHTYDESTIIKEATCTEKGEKEQVCIECGYKSTKEIEIDSSNHVGETSIENAKEATCNESGYTGDIVCDGCGEIIEEGKPTDPLEHVPGEPYIQESTCKIPGYILITCSLCDEVIHYRTGGLADHTWGEWKVVKEPTNTAAGKKERVCLVCGEPETEPIPMIQDEPKPTTAKDEKSGISVTYTKDDFDGDIQVKIEKDYTGTQFTGSFHGNIRSWNIKITLDGKEVQPSKPVLVKIPIPEGFDRNSIAVYHINSINQSRERMDITIDGDYICFYTSSFSPYVIVDESTKQVEPEPTTPTKNCTCSCHKGGITNFFWKIANFFHKLFRMNQYKTCACGKAHW